MNNNATVNLLRTSAIIDITGLRPERVTAGDKQWPNGKLATASIIFTADALRTYKLTDITLWEKDGKHGTFRYAQGPSKKYGDAKYWNYLASPNQLRRAEFSKAVVDEYNRVAGRSGDELTEPPQTEHPMVAQLSITALPSARRKWPAKLLAEFEITFLSGMLRSFSMRGLTLWKNDKDERYVRGPWRPYIAKNGDKKFFDLLRSPDEGAREALTAVALREYADELQKQLAIVAEPDDAGDDTFDGDEPPDDTFTEDETPL